MRVTIETIPHDKQRYETTGDYTVDGDEVSVFISEVGDWRSEMLVAVHELIEVLLVLHKGIAVSDIDDFDISHPELEDPGLDSRAPYHKEHMFATAVEMLMCPKLGLEWNDHNDLLEGLYNNKKEEHSDPTNQ